MTQFHDERITVLGLGKLLRRDEGPRICAAQRLLERFALPGSVQELDGNTRRLYLLCYLEDAERLLILAAAHLETLVEAAADELRRMGVEVKERTPGTKEATYA